MAKIFIYEHININKGHYFWPLINIKKALSLLLATYILGTKAIENKRKYVLKTTFWLRKVCMTKTKENDKHIKKPV